jgi:hypothetical protein
MATPSSMSSVTVTSIDDDSSDRINPIFMSPHVVLDSDTIYSLDTRYHQIMQSQLLPPTSQVSGSSDEDILVLRSSLREGILDTPTIEGAYAIGMDDMEPTLFITDRHRLYHILSNGTFRPFSIINGIHRVDCCMPHR